MPKSALNFLTFLCSFSGKVEPQFLLILKPFGLLPITFNFAPSDLINFGADLYPAPFAQSKTTLKLFNLKFLDNFFLQILISVSYTHLTLPTTMWV